MPREHTAEILDMTPFFEAKELPTDPRTGNPLIQKVIPRGTDEVWKSRMEPHQFTTKDGPLAWSLIRDGQLVRIPLLPYRTSQKPVEAMLGAMDVIQRYLEAVPNAIRTHIIIGDPIQEVDGEFRFWLGFAARLQ